MGCGKYAEIKRLAEGKQGCQIASEQFRLTKGGAPKLL